MENILNMEYSLNTILYLVELEIKEGWQSNSIRYKENYPFCDGVEYKKEVLEYLTKHNNDSLRTVLEKHKRLCNCILEKWNTELRFMNVGIKDVLHYNIYCNLRKDTNFPFDDIELIRLNNDVYERGNPYIEDNRYWSSRYLNKNKLFECWGIGNDSKMTIQDLVNADKDRNTKSVCTFMLVDFANSVNCFLSEYVSEIEALKTDTSTPERQIDSLRIIEYTKESEILTKSPEFSAVYSVLKQSYSKDVDILQMINDLRRIIAYHTQKPDECITLIENKYPMRWVMSALFIALIKLFIPKNSVFITILEGQPLYQYLPNVQQEFTDKLNAVNHSFVADNTQPQADASNENSDRVGSTATKNVKTKKEHHNKAETLKLPDGFLAELAEKGLIDAETNKWLKSDALFAYFVVKVIEKTDKECVLLYKDFKRGNPFRHGKNRKLQPFQIVFGMKEVNVSRTIDDNEKKNPTPTGYETIDEIIKKYKFIF